MKKPGVVLVESSRIPNRLIVEITGGAATAYIDTRRAIDLATGLLLWARRIRVEASFQRQARRGRASK